jgi:rapamycin-insensitive companion of mTOR
MANRDGQTPDTNTLLAPSRLNRDGRTPSANSTMAASRGGQSVGTFGPGSFSSDMRSTTSRAELTRPEFTSYNSFDRDDLKTTSEQRLAEIREQIEKEMKIKKGSENLLSALNAKSSAKQVREQQARVEHELNTTNRKLAELKLGLEAEMQREKESKETANGRFSYIFRSAAERGEEFPVDDEEEQNHETESPTYVLAEILQALEADALPPEYYVEHANALVDLFKRHPTLKYDLTWSIFGIRLQVMLLSDSREVVAAGYRLMRHAITDRKSLQTIRALHTDYLVILSLVKEGKANVEREQALKFVRAFLDVKDGVKEISIGVVRIISAVAEHGDDRLRNISIMTLAEILVRDPALLVSAGGMGTLTDVLGSGTYHAAESLAGAFLYLLDIPQRRSYLSSGYELDTPFATFTDPAAAHTHGHESRMKANAKVVASLFKSWPGLMALSVNSFVTVKSLVSALYTPFADVRNMLLEIFFDILRIKQPSWSSSFVAGRRLTTYGRVTNLKHDIPKDGSTAEEGKTGRWSLVDHYVAIVLSVLIHCGLIEVLLDAEEDSLNLTLKRKTTLLLGEVLKMASDMLPENWSANLQVLPQLLQTAATFGQEERFVATGTIYQVDGVNRTLYRSVASVSNTKSLVREDSVAGQTPSAPAAPQVDETQFRALLLDSQVLSTATWQKWNWSVIQTIISGPMANPKRLDEALKSTKFVQRIGNFYRPFKMRFSEIKNTKPNQRYVKAGVTFISTLLQNSDGVKYLMESKLIRQLAECLSIYDRMSGYTSDYPVFTEVRMLDTLTSGYFPMIGALTKDSRGMTILERWKMINMFYHIIELRGRDDLIKALIGNMDYSLDGHTRIIISKAMTSCSKDVRIFATRLLRRYATRALQAADAVSRGPMVAEWAIRLLITQLYDPEIEVCEVAVKILEEACNQTHSLEYVVKCRPALDHLGEIGAPLLLRFLSTSVGYRYLDGLDYINREMDDWFLGRNDGYVTLVEASLARAFSDVVERPQQSYTFEETPELPDYGLVPPHFYRELTRTQEGCKLLEHKGHFDEFASTIRDCGMEDEDAETIIKVKGCLWAVGNVGSMELGAPFLEKSDVVKEIVNIAEDSQVLSLRGTAVFVLGLISRSIHGQEILIQYGWDGAINEQGESLGFCVPVNFSKLFSVS